MLVFFKAVVILLAEMLLEAMVRVEEVVKSTELSAELQNFAIDKADLRNVSLVLLHDEGMEAWKKRNGAAQSAASVDASRAGDTPRMQAKA